jgi:hypothetical protein
VPCQAADPERNGRVQSDQERTQHQRQRGTLPRAATP